MKRKISNLTLLVIALALSLQSRAQAQIAVSEGVLGSGGASLADSSYRILGTLGQAFIGIVHNPTRAAAAGFWYARKHSRAGNLAKSTDTVPAQFRLRQNYPNPFNPETKIEFQLPRASHVVIKIFNILGQEVLSLTDKQYKAGIHGLRWDGRDSGGLTVASGIYLYWLQAGQFSRVRRMSLLR